MIVTVIQTVVDSSGETFERKRSYCFFCVDHSSGVADLERLKEQLTAVMRDISPLSLEMENEGHYEGNLSWDKLTLHYANVATPVDDISTVIEIDEGYNGYWEMKSFGRLRQDAQVDVSNDLLEWLFCKIDVNIDELNSLGMC
jgi:hypothetical protein